MILWLTKYVIFGTSSSPPAFFSPSLYLGPSQSTPHLNYFLIHPHLPLFYRVNVTSIFESLTLHNTWGIFQQKFAISCFLLQCAVEFSTNSLVGKYIELISIASKTYSVLDRWNNKSHFINQLSWKWT